MNRVTRTISAAGSVLNSGFRNLRIQNKIFALLGIFIVSIAVYSAFLFYSLKPVLVGGPVYGTIMNSKNFTVDIAPPICTLLDPYICAMQLADSNYRDRQVTNTQRLKDMHNSFEERVSFWEEHLGDSVMKTELADNAGLAGQKFYKVIEEQLIPAVETGDYAEARNIMQWYLTPYYDQHRSSVDRLVQLADSATTTHVAASDKAVRRTVQISLAAGMVLIVLLLALGLLVARVISAPIRRSVSGMLSLAAGDFSQSQIVDRRDEVGDMLSSMNDVSTSLSSAFGDIRGSSDAVRDAAAELKALAEAVRAGTHRARSATQESSMTSTALQDSAASIAAGAEGIAASTQSVAAAMEEMQVSGTEVVRQCGEESRMAQEAKRSVGSLAGRMDALVDATRAVSGVIDIISGIAEQTQLLSINASIEAATAGESGRSFSVVAREVKDLSARTAQSATEISAQIGEMLRTVGEARGENEEMNRMIGQFAAIAEAIDVSMQQQNAAMSEIASNIASVDQDSRKAAGSAQEMQLLTESMRNKLMLVESESTDSVAGMEKVAARSCDLETIAGALDKEVGRFQLA